METAETICAQGDSLFWLNKNDEIGVKLRY